MLVQHDELGGAAVLHLASRCHFQRGAPAECESPVNGDTAACARRSCTKRCVCRSAHVTRVTCCRICLLLKRSPATCPRCLPAQKPRTSQAGKGSAWRGGPRGGHGPLAALGVSDSGCCVPGAPPVT